MYTVGEAGRAETYTPLFAAGGLRYAQLSGLPEGVVPSIAWLSGLKVNSDVRSVSRLRLPRVGGTTGGTPDVLNRAHAMVRASQSSNLWSIPTDCPQVRAPACGREISVDTAWPLIYSRWGPCNRSVYSFPVRARNSSVGTARAPRLDGRRPDLQRGSHAEL